LGKAEFEFVVGVDATFGQGQNLGRGCEHAAVPGRDSTGALDSRKGRDKLTIPECQASLAKWTLYASCTAELVELSTSARSLPRGKCLASSSQARVPRARLGGGHGGFGKGSACLQPDTIAFAARKPEEARAKEREG
jgi:hypothetical protein